MSSPYRDYVEKVRTASNLLEVLEERGRVVESGMVLCPFHADSNPSCSVTEKLYLCFACGARGDVFRLIQHFDSLPFLAAVDALAKRAGISTYRPHHDDARRVLEAETTAAVIEWAAHTYEKALREGTEPWRYLTEGRGLPPSLVRSRRLGWSTGQLCRMLGGNSAVQALVSAGLAVEVKNAMTWSGQESARDLLYNRVTIPVIGDGQQATFLSGRSVDPETQPKYLHQRMSPTPLFNGDLLKGAQDVFIVEGQLDALSLTAWELPAAAIMGTVHAEVLQPLRGRRHVYLCLDADRAGRSALLRLVPALYPAHVRGVRLPEGMDPNDFYRARSKGEFMALVADSRDFVQFVLDAVNPDTDPVSLSQQLDPLLEALAPLPPVASGAYLSGPISTWAGTRKGLVKGIEKGIETHRAKATLQCPVCNTVLAGQRRRV